MALTNIVVQVLKTSTYEKLPTNLLALIVAEVLTIGVGIAYCQINAIPLAWYMVAALVVAGFMRAVEVVTRVVVVILRIAEPDQAQHASLSAGKGKKGGY